MIDKWYAPNIPARKAHSKKTTNNFDCFIMWYTVSPLNGPHWIEINKDAANSHKHKHELIIPTSLLNGTIPTQVRRKELKVLVLKRCFLPPFDLLLSAVSSWINMCKCLQHLQLLQALALLNSMQDGGRQTEEAVVLVVCFFHLLCFQKITDTWWQQHNIMQKKSLRLYKNSVTRCAQQCRQYMCCAFTANTPSHNL